MPRDGSWMYFNHRILEEARRPEVPLLERMSFLGIYSNNLDEFFRVRVALLNRIAECGGREARPDRDEAAAALKAINRLNARYAREYARTVGEVEAALEREGIAIVTEGQLDEAQRAFVADFYDSRLDGRLAPVWFSAVKALHDEPDDGIWLAVKMRRRSDKSHPDYALLQLPVAQAGRFVRLPDDSRGRACIMYLDDIVRACLPRLFGPLGYGLFEAWAFKFTKDAEMEIDNDLRTGLVQKISKGVKSRRRGQPLRVIYDEAMPRDVLRRVLARLDVDKLDSLLASGRYHNHKDLMSFPSCGRADLKYPAWRPALPAWAAGGGSLIDAVRRQDRFLHVPYHDFAAYTRLLQEAAIDKDVRSIRTTLYRLAHDSKVVRALVDAARNGKEVTVVIELLARFDEASNIAWSKKMQDVGIHVVFGLEGLKVHSKVTHIGMRRGADVCVVSTGNFHEGNARCYTDYLLFTARKAMTDDVARVFDFIERPYLPVRFRELLVSPNEMRTRFARLVAEEIRQCRLGRPAYIRVKINHITDPGMTDLLYQACAEGVRVELAVRGNCSLVPGLRGQSEGMRIVGIIDRYLEHARIFQFCAGGEDKVFVGSADWMPRNLSHRVEVVAPVHDERIRRDLIRAVDFALGDTSQGRLVDGRGGDPLPALPDGGDAPFRSQQALHEAYAAEAAAGE